MVSYDNCFWRYQLTKRIISGIMCALFFFLVIFLSYMYPITLNLVVSVVSILSSCELLILKRELKFNILSISSIIFASTRTFVGKGTRWNAILYTYMIICLVIAMERFIKNRKRSPDEFKSVWNVCFVFFLNAVITISLGAISEIRNYGGKYGIFLFALTIIIASTCDIGAYMFGKKFGNHKLCQYVSPHKTIEGAIGGILFSIFSSILFSIVCEQLFKVKGINYVSVILIYLLGAPISILGDLCFSLIKRLLNIKDFGNIIPGHGGVLDRFDSIIFLSPFVLIFIHVIKLAG